MYAHVDLRNRFEARLAVRLFWAFPLGFINVCSLVMAPREQQLIIIKRIFRVPVHLPKKVGAHDALQLH